MNPQYNLYFLTKCLPSEDSSSCPAGRQVNKLIQKANKLVSDTLCSKNYYL